MHGQQDSGLSTVAVILLLPIGCWAAGEYLVTHNKTFFTALFVMADFGLSLFAAVALAQLVTATRTGDRAGRLLFLIVLAVPTGVLLWFLASVFEHTRHVKNGDLRFFLMAVMPVGFMLYMLFGSPAGTASSRRS